MMSEGETDFVLDAVKRNIDKEGDDDQSFYVADFSDVVNKCRYWQYKLPRVEAFYPVTCNADRMLLRLMVALGMGFNCASMGEIDAVLSAGSSPSKILYGQPFKPNASLLYAASVHVDLMEFDSEEELRKIETLFPTARLVLRIQVPDGTTVFPASDSFGCQMEEARNLLQMGKDLDLNIVGVSFHVGVVCEKPSMFTEAIGMARQVFDAGKALDYRFTLLDIGGGFSGATASSDMFEKVCDAINQGLEEHFPEERGVRVIAEPGCYMVCSAYSLCLKILGKKVQEAQAETAGGKDKKIFYYMNDGVYGSFSDGFENYGLQIKPLLGQSELSTRPLLPSTLWGVSCCSSDCILEDTFLPDMDIGDYILFQNMGAYTLSSARTFNGFETASIRYIFPSEPLNRNASLPPLKEFLRNLGPNQQKAFFKIQNHICSGDAFDKGAEGVS